MSERFLLLMLIAPWVLTAQESAGKDAAPSSKVHLVRLKYADANRVRNLFDSSGISIKADSALDSLVLRGDPKDVDQVERLIRELDVPEAAGRSAQVKPNLEFQVFVVAAGDENKAEQPMPKGLEPAITQLRSMFPFRSYRVVETIQDRVTAGETVSSSGTLERLEPGAEAAIPKYTLVMAPEAIASAKDPVSLRFSFNAESVRPATASNGSVTGERKISSSIGTHFSLNPGQLVVVGKSGYGDVSLFLIVTAKVAN